MYQNFLDQFTDFVFVEHAPAASDIIFYPRKRVPSDGGTGRRSLAGRDGPSDPSLRQVQHSYRTFFRGFRPGRSCIPDPMRQEWAPFCGMCF